MEDVQTALWDSPLPLNRGVKSLPIRLGQTVFFLLLGWEKTRR
jgi:hypothetical protein